MKQITIILFLLLGASTSMAQTPRVEAAMQNCEYAQAEVLLKELPDSPEKRQNLITVYRRLGRTAQLAEVLNQEWESAAESGPQMIRLAELYRDSGISLKAEQAFTRALELLPGNEYIQIQLTRLAMQKKDYNRGIALCHDILAADSTSTTAYRLLGNCYYALRDLSYAFLAFKKAHELDPQDYTTNELLSSLLLEVKEYDECIKLTEPLIEQELSLTILQNNAEAYFRKEAYDTAIKRYTRLKELGDENFYTRYFLGVCYYVNQKYYEAHDEFEKALEINPEHTNLLYYMALTCSRTSWKDEAMVYIKKVEDQIIPSDSTKIWLYNAEALVYDKIPKAAEQYVDAMKKVYELDSERYTLLYAIGSRYRMLNKDKECAHYYQLFLDQAAIQEQKGKTKSRHEAYVKAAREFLEMLKKEKNTEEFWNAVK